MWVWVCKSEKIIRFGRCGEQMINAYMQIQMNTESIAAI